MIFCAVFAIARMILAVGAVHVERAAKTNAGVATGMVLAVLLGVFEIVIHVSRAFLLTTVMLSAVFAIAKICWIFVIAVHVVTVNVDVANGIITRMRRFVWDNVVMIVRSV